MELYVAILIALVVFVAAGTYFTRPRKGDDSTPRAS